MLVFSLFHMKLQPVKDQLHPGVLLAQLMQTAEYSTKCPLLILVGELASALPEGM